MKNPLFLLCKICTKRKKCKEPCEKLKKELKKIETQKEYLTFTDLGIKEENIGNPIDDIRKANPSILAEDMPEIWSINDYETQDFLGGKGEFSVEADIEFEEHLKRLQEGQEEPLWY